jgi:hypothetical protein
MKSIVFVSDMFAEQYAGGAELTTAAIMSAASASKTKVAAVQSFRLTPAIIDQHSDVHWVVCNFAGLPDETKMYMCRNCDYSIIEYDYKLCKFRSLEKHLAITGQECDCLETTEGRLNMAFYGYAKKIWFMSDVQKKIFMTRISILKEEKCEVLSSIFSPGDLRFMDSIKNNEKNNKYLILKSESWIKGTQKCIEYAKQNDLEYELVENLQYHEMLIKMSTSKGLIFRPLGGDTCPRIVIEARLLGCDLILNDNVQHANEDWFAKQDTCYSYMKERSTKFWNHYEK